MSAPTPTLGAILQSFFVDHLVVVKGLRPASVRSYRDTVRLLLVFVAAEKGGPITRLVLEDLNFERLVAFLRHLETDRHNHIPTRNQRLAAIHTLFDYIATREPEMLGVAQRVAAIPMKRTSPAETHFLERDEVEQLFAELPAQGRLALRDHALLLFLYNTGAGPRRWLRCASSTSTSANTHWCACTARAISGALARYGTRPPPCCAHCSRLSWRTPLKRPCSRLTDKPSPALAFTKWCGVTGHASTTPGPSDE